MDSTNSISTDFTTLINQGDVQAVSNYLETKILFSREITKDNQYDIVVKGSVPASEINNVEILRLLLNTRKLFIIYI
jgi:hypothetical protein